jgi:septum formation protein
VIVPRFDEEAAAAGWAGTVPDLVLRLTAGKLEALTEQNRLPGSYCALAADTVVVIDNHILGKPRDDEEAARQLRLLSGRTHQVLTGLSLLCRTPDHSFGARRSRQPMFVSPYSTRNASAGTSEQAAARQGRLVRYPRHWRRMGRTH